MLREFLCRSIREHCAILSKLELEKLPRAELSRMAEDLNLILCRAEDCPEVGTEEKQISPTRSDGAG